MATWTQFANAAPHMAERGLRQLSIGLAYLATVRKDGAPRLHPVSPIFAQGRLFVAIPSTSPKRYDLHRDGRYSIHALPPELGEDYDEFEFNITGRATLVEDPPTKSMVSESAGHAVRNDDWVFELHIETALTTVWNPRMVKDGDKWTVVPHPDLRPSRQFWKES